MRLFGIALIIAPRRQQPNARLAAVTVGRKAPAQIGKERREAPRVHPPQQIPRGAGEGEAVFQRIADTDRRAHPVRQNAPVAVRPAPQIGGVEMQIMAARWGDSDHIAPEIRTARHHGRGQLAFGDERLRPIEIADHLFQQIRPLRKPALDGAPLVRPDQQGNRAERPRPLILLAGEAEGDAEIGDLPCDFFRQSGKIAAPDIGQAPEHGEPMARHSRGGARIHIARRGFARIGFEPGIEHHLALGIAAGITLTSHDLNRGTRKSRVIGNSPVISSGGTETYPGVCP